MLKKHKLFLSNNKINKILLTKKEKVFQYDVPVFGISKSGNPRHACKSYC